MVERVDQTEPLSARQDLERLLNKYAAAISSGPLDMGRTNIVTHKIDTGGHPPIRQALRTIPYAQRPEVEKDIDEKLRMRTIEPACSPHAVKKRKSGMAPFARVATTGR